MRTRLDQQKKQHRERAQPLNRQRLGLLEKHKDYVKRAKDFHSKEDRIKKLREKAAGRNKDEFYFGMIRSKTKGGVHIQDRGNDPMPVDVVKLLKTQDAGYVRTLLATEEKLIERLRNELGSTVGLREQEGAVIMGEMDSEDEDMLEEDDRGEGTSKQEILRLLGAGESQGKKTVFVDSAKQVARFNPKKLSLASSITKATPAATSSKSSSSRKGKGKATGTDDEPSASETASSLKSAQDSHLRSLTSELSARLERLALLQRTYREMQVQKNVMGGGSKNVIGDRKQTLSREEERLKEMESMDELEIKRMNKEKRKLPEPERGVKTGARVWKWKTERRR